MGLEQGKARGILGHSLRSVLWQGLAGPGPDRPHMASQRCLWQGSFLPVCQPEVVAGCSCEARHLLFRDRRQQWRAQVRQGGPRHEVRGCEGQGPVREVDPGRLEGLHCLRVAAGRVAVDAAQDVDRWSPA
eukprot:9860298-Alexandrium_andersonii.AAC.1